MIVVIAVLAGALWGGYQAKRRGGNRKDVAQYAIVHAIIFGLIGLFVAISLARG